MLCGSKSQAAVESGESGDKVWYDVIAMDKKQSKRVGIVFVILALVGLVYLGWYLLRGNTALENNTTDSTTKTSTPTTTATPTKSNDIPTTSTTDWLSFNKDGFNFTFKYPKNWTIDTTTATAMADNPDITQKNVKIKTNAGVEFNLDNPAIETDSDGYDLKNTKDISTGTLTFNRNYGPNSDDQTLYTATYNDPNNLDAASVSFDGFGTIDAVTIGNLDNIVSSFKFTQ